MNPQRTVMIFAGLLGLTGVGLGALGAHALKGIIAEHAGKDIWQIAVVYNLAHAVAMLSLLGSKNKNNQRWPQHIVWTVICWAIGILLFSGSLYALALGAPPSIGPLTPVGGLFLLIGWVLIILAGCRNSIHSAPPHG